MEEVDNIKIYPWTHRQLLKLAPTLEKVVSLIEEEGVTIQGILAMAEEPRKLIHLVFKFLPFLTPIISETLGIDPQEVEGWQFDKTARVALVIMIENVVTLRKFVLLGNTVLDSFKKSLN